jgi:hypothetical protein
VHPNPLGPPQPDQEIGEDEFWSSYDAKRSVDELFHLVAAYRTGKDYFRLMTFIKRFRFYSPYNAMLVYAQRPGATFVAPPRKWLDDFGRTIQPGATPIVILQPRGPVMFVFDVIDTEPLPGAPELPRGVLQPFDATGCEVGTELELTIENAVRDGIRISEALLGSQQAGSIKTVTTGHTQQFKKRRRPTVEYSTVKITYELLMNARHSRTIRYATLAHELGHLYCGHLGTPNKNWWPDRKKLAEHQREFEAESVCYLVCQRLGIKVNSEDYLVEYAKSGREIPAISVETVLKAAGQIEKMGREYLSLRK